MRVGDYYPPDLTDLPVEVRRTARIFSNGEVAWPNEYAERAIIAISNANKVITGLDARTLHEDGELQEVPISAWLEIEGEGREAAVTRARQEALEALPLARNEGTYVLLGWL